MTTHFRLRFAHHINDAFDRANGLGASIYLAHTKHIVTERPANSFVTSG